MQFESIFPMGLGTTRFPVIGRHDETGLEESVKITLAALEAGVRYIDTSYAYSRGMALHVLREAFKQTTRPYDVTLKVNQKRDRDADGAMRSVEYSFNQMGISSAPHFLLWGIGSMDEYSAAMKKGSIYDAAMRLKDQGIIKHIGCSMHVPVQDAIQIIKDGVFDAVTVTYNYMNATAMQPVLGAALQCGVAVVVMNPLGGGFIPRHPALFEAYKCDEDESPVASALRYVKSHPAVKIVLSGVSGMAELEQNIQAFTEPSSLTDAQRLQKVNILAENITDICTGCRYCEGCPAGIPVPVLVNAANILALQKELQPNAEAQKQINAEIFRTVKREYGGMPESPKNPCTKCGECERKCTQKLNTIGIVDEVYRRVGQCGFSLASWKHRFDALLHGKPYSTVGFYPGGGYLAKVLALYRQLFGDFKFDKRVIFDSNPALKGRVITDMEVFSPDDIPGIQPDCILICNYNFQDEIYTSLEKYSDTIDILTLHDENCIPLT